MEIDEDKIKSVPRQTAVELAGSLGKFVDDYEPIIESKVKIKRLIAKKIAEEGLNIV